MCPEVRNELQRSRRGRVGLHRKDSCVSSPAKRKDIGAGGCFPIVVEEEPTQPPSFQVLVDCASFS